MLWVTSIILTIIPAILAVYIEPFNNMKMLVFYWTVTKHKYGVAARLLKLAFHIIWRAIIHDLSKFKFSEARGFTGHLHKLNSSAYGSEKYINNFHEDGIAQAVSLHYDRNRHHPEHFDNGIRAMNLVDLAEMLADWAVASKRAPGGNLLISLNINRGRFGIDYPTLLTLENTAAAFFRKDLQ